LRVIHTPLAFHAIAENYLAFPVLQEWVVLRFNEFDIELVVVRRKVTQGFFTYVSSHSIFVIDMDEYAGFGLPAFRYRFTHELPPENSDNCQSIQRRRIGQVNGSLNAPHRSFDRFHYGILADGAWQGDPMSEAAGTA